MNFSWSFFFLRIRGATEVWKSTCVYPSLSSNSGKMVAPGTPSVRFLLGNLGLLNTSNYGTWLSRFGILGLPLSNNPFHHPKKPGPKRNHTLPETNIFAPENGGPLEVRRFLLETTIFRSELLVSGRVTGWWFQIFSIFIPTWRNDEN